jgi:uncharacterized MAPEG superfamily protein
MLIVSSEFLRFVSCPFFWLSIREHPKVGPGHFRVLLFPEMTTICFTVSTAHMNSVEALAPFVVPALLAMMVGVGSTTLAVLVWTFAVIRLIHLIVYLRGGKAAKGGSVRTILYVAGALVTAVLIIVTGAAAIY